MTLAAAHSVGLHAGYVRTREDAPVKDKGYQRSPIGQECKRCLDALKWEGAPLNTRDSYEIAWARLSEDYAHIPSLAAFVEDQAEAVAEISQFLARHWGKKAPTTRKARQAAVWHLFNWAINAMLIPDWNPVDRIKRPKGKSQPRQAHPPSILAQLIYSQDELEDRVILGLLGRLAIRKEGVNLMQARHVNRVTGIVGFRLKGGGWGELPYNEFESFALDLDFFIQAHELKPTDYLLSHRNGNRSKPIVASTFHRRFKGWLKKAGLPDFPMHELRHTAADFARRATDTYVAKDLLKHASVSTTETYLHSDMDEFRAKLRLVEAAWQDELVRSRGGEDA